MSLDCETYPIITTQNALKKIYRFPRLIYIKPHYKNRKQLLAMSWN